MATVEATALADATVSTKDSAGATWTLTIRAGALMDATTITMAPLATADTTGLAGPATGGVMLGPAGVHFVIPATLAVARSSVRGGTAIVQGDEAGNARLLLPETTAWDTVAIEHFSPTTTIDPADPQWVLTLQALADRAGSDAAARAKAAKLAKEPITVPRPPSIPWECRDEAAKAKADARYQEYFDELTAPEMGLIRTMLAAEQARQLQGTSDGSGTTAVHPLVERLVQKARELLRETRGQADVYLPTIWATLSIAKQAQLLGYESDAVTALLGEIPGWVDAVFDPVIGRIVTGHEYQLASMALEVARTSAVLGKEVDLERVQSKIEKAMVFKATLTLTLNYPRQEWKLETGSLRMGLSLLRPDSPAYLSGSGNGKYLSYTAQDPAITLEGKPFVVQADLFGTDFCAGTALFVVDRFAADTETYYLGQDFDRELGLAKAGAEAAFADRVLTEEHVGQWTQFIGRFGFAVKLRDKDATIIDDTLDGVAGKSQGKVSASYHIVLTHTPEVAP